MLTLKSSDRKMQYPKITSHIHVIPSCALKGEHGKSGSGRRGGRELSNTFWSLKKGGTETVL